MKENIIKWCLQFFLSSLLSFLTLKYGRHFVGYGDQANMIIILFCIPLASTAGVVLGDISLYKGKELINQAIVVALVLAVAGVVLSDSGYFSVLLKNYFSSYANRWFWFTLIPYFSGQVAILPLIGYNFITMRYRKRRSAQNK